VGVDLLFWRGFSGESFLRRGFGKKGNSKISAMKMHNHAKPISSQQNNFFGVAVIQKVKGTFNAKYLTNCIGMKI
jgi:hypothetical protein